MRVLLVALLGCSTSWAFTPEEEASCGLQIRSLRTAEGRLNREPNSARAKTWVEHWQQQVDRCTAGLRRRALEAEQAAQRAELRRQEEAARRAAEEERIAARARDEQAKEEQRKAFGQDPKNARVILGTALCIARRTRAEALAEIAKEKRYSRVGGVIDKQKLYELQQRIRWADEREVADRKSLKAWAPLKPAPCSDPDVKRVIACKIDNEGCDERLEMLCSFVSVYEDE